MKPVFELPSKVTVSLSRRKFLVRYGYSDRVMYFATIDDCVRDIIDYYIARKVSSVMTDLKSIIQAVNSVKEEVIKDISVVNKALEDAVAQREDLFLLLSRENHYRTSAKTPPEDHVRRVEQVLKPQPATKKIGELKCNPQPQ